MVERDRVPREVFRDLQGIVREMRGIEPLLDGAKVVADAQILFSLDNALARDRASEPLFWMEIQLPDAHRYRLPLWRKETLRAVYTPLARFGLTLDLVGEDAEWDVTRPLIAPDLDNLHPGVGRKVDRLVRARRHADLLPPAQASATNSAPSATPPPPGLLAPLFGVSLRDYYPLEPDCGSAFDHQAGRAMALTGVDPNVTVTVIRVNGVDIPCDVRHGEVLAIDDAEVLGTYTSGLYAGLPAMSVRKVGSGRAIYLGAVPANANAGVLFYQQVLPELTTQELPYRKVSWKSPQGDFAFLLNEKPVTVALAMTVKDLITGGELTELPPFGVAMVKA